MALLEIKKYPNDALRQQSKDVKDVAAVQTLIDDMIETMFKNEGVGLAAPQIGVLKRIIIAAPKSDDKELYVYINPVITQSEGEQLGSEGCLSVPGTCGEVKRAKKIWVTAKERDGKSVSFIAEDFFARIIQHETDHLFGKLYIDHLGFNARKTALDCLRTELL